MIRQSGVPPDARTTPAATVMSAMTQSLGLVNCR